MPDRRSPSSRDREQIILLRATLAAAIYFLEQIASAHRDEGRMTSTRLVEAAVARYRAVLDATQPGEVDRDDRIRPRLPRATGSRRGDRRVRHTAEQRDARAWLVQLAAQVNDRLRIADDAEGFPVIPGRLGRVEWYCDGVACHACRLPGQRALAVYTDRPRLVPKLLAIPGVRGHQMGERGARCVFPTEPALLAAVCRVIGARVRRRTGAAALAVPTPAMVAARAAFAERTRSHRVRVLRRDFREPEGARIAGAIPGDSLEAPRGVEGPGTESTRETP